MGIGEATAILNARGASLYGDSPESKTVTSVWWEPRHGKDLRLLESLPELVDVSLLRGGDLDVGRRI